LENLSLYIINKSVNNKLTKLLISRRRAIVALFAFCLKNGDSRSADYLAIDNGR